jgi:alpha-L-fucosidase
VGILYLFSSALITPAKVERTEKGSANALRGMFAHMLASLFAIVAVCSAQYAPNWTSLDTRPLPLWYDSAKIGIFLHWGIFSVPSFGVDSGGASGEWFWWNWQGAKQQEYIDFVARTEAPSFTYADYAPRFQAEFFNATQWLALFKASGAKYIVPTSKHHEGWTNWPSATSFNWNSVDVGPHRDIIGELAAATKAAGLTFGVYHSLFEWFNPLYLQDKAGGFKANLSDSAFLQKTFGELKELTNRYQPELFWSDGDWEAPDSYWNAPENFLAWLVNESPVKDTVVFNDRWGQGDTCHHGCECIRAAASARAPSAHPMPGCHSPCLLPLPSLLPPPLSPFPPTFFYPCSPSLLDLQ